MHETKLVVSDFSDFNEGYPVWSNIHMEIAGNAFPSPDWYDATSAILGMWMDSLVDLIRRQVDHVDLCYMDGDYFISLTIETTTLARAKCIAPAGEIALEESIDLISLSLQVLHACEQLLDKYKQFNRSREIQVLNSASSKLSKLIQQVGNDSIK